ncbi:MAG: ATP-binding cassette domain-containing protein [Rhodobacteraceae bacterium]|nr:ATP-binding cassette domain-containing protein [Paracoccaceae bacterium]
MALEVDVAISRGDFEVAVKFNAGPGFTALFGPSGAGKSTILDMVAGTLTPARGRIHIHDRPVFDSSSGIHVPLERRRIGYVFQDRRLFPHMSVERNLRYGMAKAAKIDIAFEDVVGLLGLDRLLTRKPMTLSGGEQQRVAIGRALLSQPAFLLMDEPLASLDARRKDEVMPYLIGLRDRFQIPCLYVSHDQAEIERLTDRVIHVDGGRIA